MNAIRVFLREELTGWKAWEWLALAGSCLVIVALSLYWQDTVLGIVSSATGVAYTVCNGKGKRIAYVFGIVNSVLYAYISFNAHVYGDVVLYGLYYFPAMIVGWILWQRNLDISNYEVIKRAMSAKGRLVLVGACVALTAAGALVLDLVGDASPILDSFTTMVSVIALVVALGRYQEQWPLWTAVNAAEIILWTTRLLRGDTPEAGSTLIMWTLFLVIGIVMWVRWARQINSQQSAASIQ